MRKPLDGVRVLDLSRVLAGPWCGQQLADLGADVIKVERPGRGDDTRSWGPPWHETSHEAAYFLSANRGKRSLSVNLATEQGQSIVRRLAQQSDVLIENFKVGGLKSYGLDYESLKVLNPRLIYCSITGFGQDGPYSHRAGYDFMIQGLGGLMSLTGEPDGEPMKTGVAFADIFTGLYAANAVLAALWERERTGSGSHIDMALLDVQVGVLANQALNYLVSGKAPRRLGNAHPNIVPYEAFPTANGHIIITVGNDNQFHRLCEVLGDTKLAEDDRFITNAARVKNRSELVEILTRLLAKDTTNTWIIALEKVGVPCAPINTLDQTFNDAQVVHRGMRITLRDRDNAKVDLVANPIVLDGQRLQATKPPPRLGEHNEQVLRSQLGLTDDDLLALRRQGIVGD